MNTIVLLCGGDSSGKTTTWRNFFQSCITIGRRPLEFYKRVLQGKTVYGVGADSIQELQQTRTKTLCDLACVKGEIEKRIQLCENDAKGQSFVLMFPYGMYESSDRSKLNEECFLEPVEWLRTEKGVNVFPVYLRKTNATHKAKKDDLARKICLREIETSKKDFNKSKEIEEILMEAITKGLIP